MKNVKLGLCIVLAAIAVSLFIVHFHQTEARGAAAAAAARPTTVAVCNLTRVFADYKWATQLNNELNERRNKIKNEITSRRNAIDKLTEQLKGYAPGSEQFNVKKQERDRQVIELEVWRQIQERSLLQSHLRLTKEMFSKISEAVKTVAQKKGIDLVLQLEPRDIQAQSSQEMIAQLLNRKTLYQSDALDITGDVLRLINEDFVANPPKGIKLD